MLSLTWAFDRRRRKLIGHSTGCDHSTTPIEAALKAA
jgi:hypothetical protein